MSEIDSTFDSYREYEVAFLPFTLQTFELYRESLKNKKAEVRCCGKYTLTKGGISQVFECAA